MEKELCAKHTPGPWKCYQNGNSEWLIENGSDLVAWPINGRTPDEIAANAHVMSAAPQMLSRLKQLLHQNCKCNGNRVCGDHRLIAKAEGKTV